MASKRIYLDATQLAEREETKVFRDLATTPRVEIRTKRSHSAPMHLKSYEIDGRVLRTGAANFSASGLKRQDNDLIIAQLGTESPAAIYAKCADGRSYRRRVLWRAKREI